MQVITRVCLRSVLVLTVACGGDVAQSDVTAPQYAKPGSAPDPAPTWLFPANPDGLAVISDGAFVRDGYSEYTPNVCGVNTHIYISNGGGDATMQTYNPKLKSNGKDCPDYPRKLTLNFPDEPETVSAVFINLQTLQTATWSIPANQVVRRGLNIQSPRCDRIRYASELRTGELIAGDSVYVKRIDARTWEVWTGAEEDRAYCVSEGVPYNMPLSFRIVSNVDLP